MKNHEIFMRLAEIRASSQSDLEKCTQAFLLVATFLQNTGSVPIPLEVKVQLRACVDEFYLRARQAGAVH